MSHIYHMVPKNLIGNTLYPLNQLKIYLPEVYNNQVKKYFGREVLMQRKINILDCLWNDVLHFSTVHPSQICNAFISMGFPWHVSNWFKINPTDIALSRQNTAIYINHTAPKKKSDFGNFNLANIDYYAFLQELLNKLTELPTANLEYLNFAKANNEQPLLFQNIPHVLYRASVNISDVEIISC